MTTDTFTSRHIGPRTEETELMLKKTGAPSLDALIEETVPASIRLKKPLNIPDGLSEYEYSRHIKEIASKNSVFRTYIGLGYYNCITPAVIQRNILENPGWYTAYTPYQSEIAQGRLEALLNFQTMVIELTAMDIANASLLDEATAAAEAMTMLYNTRTKDAVKREANVFFVSAQCFPQTIEVLKTRSEPLGIELLIGNHEEINFSKVQNFEKDKIFGALLQYPAEDGAIYDYSGFVKKAHAHDISVAVAADLLCMALLTPPGEWGADVVVGSTQRFGIPMGYGGPHAAYFAAKEQFKRNIPGRIIGVSTDAQGNRALRMALQTREQHIRRDKATSNICTSQVLLAVMAGMYAIYHGPKGLKAIANRINQLTTLLNDELTKSGYTQTNEHYFDTLSIKLPKNVSIKEIQKSALSAELNFRYLDDGTVGISVDETTDIKDINDIVNVFKYPETRNQKPEALRNVETLNLSVSIESIRNVETPKLGVSTLPNHLIRKSKFLTHPLFNTHHSETGMMRYIKKLENMDLSLNHSMIPLGSCTMKLNAASELLPLSWREFGAIHPFVPVEQAKGYFQVIGELEKLLCEITGFAAVSLQPNSGAQGEFAGLMVIRSYHRNRGQKHRKIVLIPASAHGTNPASAVMAGMKVIVVKCDEKGNIALDDLKEKAAIYKKELAAFMITYPSTHGVFEENIADINRIIHENGGQVYMDGANMNAQIGLTNPAIIGADVCHLNLHKTFAIPHGGGGPGMGPIAVAAHLKPFLPSYKAHTLPFTKEREFQSAGAPLPFGKGPGDGLPLSISAAPYGSPFVLLISYGYIKMMGGKGLTEATKIAILNANYIKEALEKHYAILYKGKNNRVAHEMILDCREFKKTAKIEAEDIAKRLIDYGFHAPTVSFPVPGTMMIEPTESEPLQELDRFCEAMLSIRKEISETASTEDNVLKNAPHTASVIAADSWQHPYSRQKAAYPLEWVRENKFWPPVSRVDNAYGDRNLVCSCTTVDNYTETAIIT